MSRSVQLVDFAATLVRETDKAFCLDAGDGPVWVPKSQVEDNGDGTYTAPEWLAVEKGFDR